MSKITARSGLTATINRDDSSKALESIVIEYDPAIAGVIDDDTFYDRLAYKVYDDLTTEEINDSYDVEFRQELNVLIWTITPGSDKSYTDVWSDLYEAIVAAPADAEGDEDPDDEGEDPDDEDPEDKDDEDEPKKSDPKKDSPKKDSSKGQPKKDDSKKDQPKKDEPKKKAPPKKDANGTYYDSDEGRYHSDDSDIEEGLDEFYTLFHNSL